MGRQAPVRSATAPADVSGLLRGGLGDALEALPLGITITDIDRRIIYTNPADAEMHGYGVDELIGRPSRLFAPPSFARPISEGELRARPLWQRQGVNVRKDGSRFPVRLLSRVIHDDGKRPVAIVTTCEDLTDYVRNLRALETSERLHRSFVERAVHGIFRATPEGRFLEVNPALVRMLGYASAADVVGLDPARDVYVDAGALTRLLEVLRRGEQYHGTEVRWRRKDGEVIDVRLSGSATPNEHAGVEFIEIFAEDVSENESLRARLRQAQKMELLGQWTGGIAHDFNNILTIILSNVEILASAVPVEHADLQEELTSLREAAARGTAMVRKLLSFGRRREVQQEPVSLPRLVDGLIGSIRRLLPDTIDVRVRHDEGLQPVPGDVGVVEQVLLNLVTNARDAMPNGGTLMVRTERRRIEPGHRLERGWGRPGDYGCVVVRDTGIGMAPAMVAHIFEPFFTTKGSGAGTGLGMTMVFGLLKQHGGFVDVESEVGVGTTVALYFPFSRGPQAEPAPARRAPMRSTAPAGGGETVLLVEDEPPIRRATKRLLERYGYTVLEAGAGDEALQVLEESDATIGLVITDSSMPRMGGHELYEAARARGSRIPFLMVSGHGWNAADDGRSPTEIPILPKPWLPDELLAAIRGAIDGSPRPATPH